MYLTNSGGLEQRIGVYSSSGSKLSCSGSPTINYSKLELKAAPELIKSDYGAALPVINMDKPLEKIGISVFSPYNKGKKGYKTLRGGYAAGSYSGSFYNNRKFMPKTVEVFNPDNFLSDKRVPVQFVGKSNEIKDLIVQAFMKTTGLYFPSDIIVKVCNEDEMKFFNRNWQPNVNGFCFNRKGNGISEVFVLHGDLDRVMLTIGHEIGHCLSLPLDNPKNEEAKAFAFSLAWAKKIKENNIGNLAMNIDLRPAENGIHDAALAYVFRMLKKGEQALDIYRKLVKKELSMEVKNGLCTGS